MPDSDSLSLLLNSFPQWVCILDRKEKEFEIVASPYLPDGSKGKNFELVVRSVKSKVVVSEKVVGSLLPKHCPERHINKGGTFCLELDVGQSIDSKERVTQWWQWLGEYLILQQTVAEKYGVWPKKYSLSHGDSAKFQLEIEDAGKELGWSDKVIEKILNKEQKILFLLPIHKQNGQVFLRERADCPFGCVRNGKAVKIKKCNHVIDLLKSEYRFHESERLFIESLKKEGFQCCKTMKNCPFNQDK